MAFTYFFRDLQVLEAIRDLVVPELRSRRYIHIWNPGCAMGPEPYSLAIMIREGMGHMAFRNVRIWATDIDESGDFGTVIKEAVYPADQVERIPAEFLKKYFIPDSLRPDHFRLNDEIRGAVQYQKHDLLTLQPFHAQCSLILCKNVLLHFNEGQRIEVLKMFHQALTDGGFLATEQTQKIPAAVSHLFSPVISNTQLFRKAEVIHPVNRNMAERPVHENS